MSIREEIKGKLLVRITSLAVVKVRDELEERRHLLWHNRISERL